MHHSTLLTAVAREVQARGAVLVVIVWAQRDQAKRALLRAAGLSVASDAWLRTCRPPLTGGHEANLLNEVHREKRIGGTRHARSTARRDYRRF